MQVPERITANALNLVGVQQQQLQGVESFEDSIGQVLDFVAVEDAGGEYVKVSNSLFVKHS